MITAQAENFVVTSNQFAGPGTLQEALKKARDNGEAEQDSILFKMPGTIDFSRTITLTGNLSAFPISSNLVIDGSTQPGAPFGVGNAKVIFAFNFPASLPAGTIDQFEIKGFQDLSIFGIYFKNTSALQKEGYAPIVISGSERITIGAPGKGNVFYNFSRPLDVYSENAGNSTSDITVQTNVFNLGLDGRVDGTTYQAGENNSAVTRDFLPVRFRHVNGTIKIGGTNADEGNVFASGLQIEDIFGPGSGYTGSDPGVPANYDIAENKFGIEYIRDLSTSFVHVFSVKGLGNEDNLKISRNKFGGKRAGKALLDLNDIKARVEVQGNVIGITRTNIDLGSDIGMSVSQTTNITIKWNTLAYLNKPLVLDINKGVIISENSMFCNSGLVPMYQQNISGVPTVSVLGSDINSVWGQAAPASIVELFYADDCGMCNPKYFVNSVIANAQGEWRYQHHISLDGAIVASATLNNITSEFTNEIENVEVDTSEMKIIAECAGSENGKILGIRVPDVAEYKIEWINSRSECGYDHLDLEGCGLTGVPAGRYCMRLKRGNNCPAYTTKWFVIPELNPIAINGTKAKITTAQCGQDNGKIEKLEVSNAAKYEWLDLEDNGRVISSGTATPDLTSAPAGLFQLRATGGSCEVLSAPFRIERDTPLGTPQFEVKKVYPCGSSGGSLSIALKSEFPNYSVRWITEANEEAGRDTILPNIPAGTYRLLLTNTSGCEFLFGKYLLTLQSEIKILTDIVKATNDTCGKSTGKIINMVIDSGKPPYKYKWFNQDNLLVGTSLELTTVKAGTYRLEASDSTACTDISPPFEILPVTQDFDTPAVKDIQLCTPEPVVLAVRNPQKVRYYLYEHESDTSALQESDTGVFQVAPKTSVTYYISGKSGTCESKRTPVTVTISLADIKFPGLLSPNGDGINDTWKLNGIENYSNSLVRIYNRFGGIVFQSVGYPAPFDGTSNGKPLPGGSYYYIIELSKDCKAVSGNLTIVR